jgi:hypothetical protein
MENSFRVMKTKLKDGYEIEIVMNYEGEMDDLVEEWRKSELPKTNGSLAMFLNSEWKGKYFATSKLCYELMGMNDTLKSTTEWTPLYFELSNGGAIDIMHRIPGGIDSKYERAVLDEWVYYAEEYTADSLINYLKKMFHIEAIKKSEFQTRN